MIPYIIVLVILLLFKFNNNQYKNTISIKNNSIWEDTKLYDDIMNNKIYVLYENKNPDMIYNPMSNLEYYKTPWNTIETVPLDYLAKHNDNIKIIYNVPVNQFTELIQKR
jgi:hypothetical protein